MKDVTSFEFFELDTSPDITLHSEKVDRAFWFWKNSWEKTFLELGVKAKTKMTSDEFLHKKMLGLFDQGDPVALIFYSEMDVTKTCVREHSYFENYPKECVKFLKLNFKKIFILSHISVHPHYRRKHTNIPLSELMFSLGMRAFKESRSDVLIGYIRHEIKDIFYRHGAIKMGSGKRHNIEVDYCYVTKDLVRPTTYPMVAKVAKDFWNNKNRRKINENYFELGHYISPDEKTL